MLAELDPLITAGLLPAPRLRATAEVGPWFALIVDDIDGKQPSLPWRDGQLGMVLSALDRLAGVPAPAALPAITDVPAEDFTSWRTLAANPGIGGLDPWSRSRLDTLAAMEATWQCHAAGETLLHADIRADNVLLTGDRIVFVDWPHACRGAAFVDLVFFAPSMALQGGPAPAELLARSRSAHTTGGNRSRPWCARSPGTSRTGHCCRRRPACRRSAPSRPRRPK